MPLLSLQRHGVKLLLPLAAVVALALLYAVGGIVGSAMGGGAGQALFVPLSVAPLASLASGLAQAVVAWVLAWQRIRAPEVTR